MAKDCRLVCPLSPSGSVRSWSGLEADMGPRRSARASDRKGLLHEALLHAMLSMSSVSASTF